MRFVETSAFRGRSLASFVVFRFRQFQPLELDHALLARHSPRETNFERATIAQPVRSCQSESQCSFPFFFFFFFSFFLSSLLLLSFSTGGGKTSFIIFFQRGGKTLNGAASALRFRVRLFLIDSRQSVYHDASPAARMAGSRAKETVY